MVDVRPMKQLADRLARTSASELLFRARAKASVVTEAVACMSGRATWRRSDLGRTLLPCSEHLQEAVAALRAGDSSRAGRAVRSHFATRQPRFPIDPHRRQEFVRTLKAQFPGALDDATSRAHRLLAGRYDLLGYRGLSFAGTGATDWHFDPVHGRRAPARFWTQVPYLDPQVGDHKVIWELNRHQHWLALGRAAWLSGDRRYIEAIASELESWMEANPPLRGINWSSMLELAFRSLSWIWALHLAASVDASEDPAWFLDLLLGLDRQLDHVARHLSVYFSPNTHLLGEALALYVGGRALPELASAARWERTGRDILIAEIVRQVHADGGHVELSAHYHRYALDFYLLALTVARRTGDPAADVFSEVVSRLAAFCRTIADDDGRLPSLGDDDGGMLFPICGRSPVHASDSLALAGSLLGRDDLPVGAAPEEVLWMVGGDERALPRAAGPASASRFLADTGYAVLRSAAGHAILDAGRHGFLNGGHAHADALSLVLSIAGRPFLIDPGTATYTMDATVRDRFRSEVMHNTLAIAGRPQSVPRGPFHWASRTDARLDLWRLADEIDCAEALHEGYAPLLHRRAVVRVDGALWLIADHLLGSGECEAANYWHFHPDWTSADGSGNEHRLTHADGLFASLVSTAGIADRMHGDGQGLGWFSPAYGQVVPATTLRFSAAEEAPASRVTAIAWNTTPVQLGIERAPVLADEEDGWHRAAVSVTLDKATVVALFAAPREDADAARAIHRVSVPRGQLATDARLAILRLSPAGEPLTISAIGARSLEWRGLGGFKTSPTREARDLHFDSAALRRNHTDVSGVTRGEAVEEMAMNGVRRVG